MTRARWTALFAILVILAVFLAQRALRPHLSPGVVLWDADLSHLDFGGGHAEKAELWCANLREADFSYAVLSGAKLGGADLQGARLDSANLTGANLCLANLQGADLHGADLSDADLQGAHLEGADLEGVFYTAKTRWPAGFEPQSSMKLTGPASTGKKPETVQVRVTKVASTPTHLERKWTLTSASECPVVVRNLHGASTDAAVSPTDTSELEVKALYLDEKASKAQGYASPGVHREWKSTVRHHSRYASGTSQSATSQNTMNQPLQPAAVPLDTDLTLAIPTELPLVSLHGETHLLQIGEGFVTPVVTERMLVDGSGVLAVALVVGMPGMLFLAFRLWRRRARTIPKIKE